MAFIALGLALSKARLRQAPSQNPLPFVLFEVIKELLIVVLPVPLVSHLCHRFTSFQFHNVWYFLGFFVVGGVT